MVKRRADSAGATRFAENLARLRRGREYSLQELARRAKVSKSMISKVENGSVQPSLDIAVRLAEALGTTLSDVMRHDSYARTILLKAADQSIIKDPKTGAERRILSPVFDGHSLEILRTAIGPNASLGTYPAHAAGTEEYVLVLKGRLRVHIGARQQDLRQGDSLFFEANFPHELANPGPSVAEIIVVIKH